MSDGGTRDSASAGAQAQGPPFGAFMRELRARKVPVGMTEWMTFMRALSMGLHHSSLTGFYHLGRSILVHSEAQFDAYDQAFAVTFEGVPAEALAIADDLLEWLRDPKQFDVSDEQLARMKELGLDDLIREFEKRLREQTERHDGGDRWVGTGGTSPFGHSGQNPAGLRVGGPGGGRSAMQIAGERRFRAYRSDMVLDVRQISAALRRLRELSREGAQEELDLEETIDRTSRNAGDLEIVMRPPRRNNVRVLLLLDVGGSMTPYSRLVSRLLTAAKQAHHLRELRVLYFHNCVYESLYEDAAFRNPVPVADVLHTTQPTYKLIVVGDAYMHPAEMLEAGGSIYYSHRNARPGIYWLKQLVDHYQRAAWLNPEPPQFWDQPTIRLANALFPMFPLTVQGITEAVQELIGGRGHSATQERDRRRAELRNDPYVRGHGILKKILD